MSTVCCITARSPSRWRLLRARKSRSPRHVTLCTVIAHSMLLCVCVRACGHRHTHARKHSGAYWDEETRLQHQYTGEWLPHSAHLVRVLTGWTTDVGGPTALALKHCCQASQRANTMSRKLSLRGDYSKRALYQKRSKTFFYGAFKNSDILNSIFFQFDTASHAVQEARES